jgi:transglutaminase-like putative cysteine protease
MMDAEPLRGDAGAPKWYPTWGYVSISSMSSWEEVVRSTLSFYTGSDALPADLAARVDDIAAAFPAAEDRITEALRLVQDEVRYVSSVIGEGAFVPRTPAEVMQLGYGDCKDKSVLLVAMLRRLGIEAHPALAHLSAGRRLPKVAPSPVSFDHVIVQVVHEGRNYWLEPTSTHQGGRFPDLAPMNYGWVLPIAPGSAELLWTGAEPLSDANVHTVEHYTRDVAAAGPLSLDIVTTYDGAEADAMRYWLANSSEFEIERTFLEYYSGFYPGMTTAEPMRFSDDRDANRMVIEENYLIDEAALQEGALEVELPLYASGLAMFDDLPGGARSAPYALGFPFFRKHTIVMETPGLQLYGPENVVIRDEAFAFDLVSAAANDRLDMEFSLQTLADSVQPERYAAFRAQAQETDTKLYWTMDVSPGAGTTDVATGVAILLFVAGLLVFLVFAAIHGLKHDAAYAAEAQFYPTSVLKFIALNIAMLGLYSIFWMWKCWRWVKMKDEPDILPFWRTFFSVFWFYALFDAVNDRTGKPRPVWIGALLAVIYFIWVVGGSVAEGLTEVATDPGIRVALNVLSLSTTFAMLCFLPILIAVNRMNGEGSHALAANSRWSWWNIAGLVLGIPIWSLVIMGYFFA